MLILSSLRPGLLRVLCGVLGAAMLEPKRATSPRRLLSVVLGPIGLLHLVSLRRNSHRYCPVCDERIAVHLNICPHCVYDVERSEASPFSPEGSEDSDLMAVG